MSCTIITRSVPPCAYCDNAKALLDSKGIAYTEYDLSANEGSIELFKILGYTKIPVITDDGHNIGGYTELVRYLEPRKTAEVSDTLPDYIAY